LGLPACEAWIVHVPALSSLTVVPDDALATVQTDEVDDVKLTVRPEDAVAVMAIGADPNARFGRVPKVMVWLAGVTVKLWVTATAAA
jgi:hypothetical protein